MSADEDSDLEILPNPVADGTAIIELSDNDNSDLQDLTGNDDNQIHSNQNNKKRSIKHESNSHHPAKKRRTNNNITPLTREDEQIINIKTEKNKEIKIANKSVNINKETWKSTGINSYQFSQAHDGLYYGGNCLNNNCIAFNERVTIQRGYGLFEPIKDEQNNYMKCPGCLHVFKLKTINMFKCNAIITYQLFGDKQVKTKEINVSGSDYVEFGDIINKINNISNNNNNNNNRISNSQNKYQDLYKVFNFCTKRNA